MRNTLESVLEPEGASEWVRRALQRLYHWERTWYAPCDSLAEFRNLQRVAADRLAIGPAPGGRPGSALRVEVRDGDVVPHTGAHWRAEAIGPEEHQGSGMTKFRWMTLFDAAYPRNPVSPQGQIWQVFFQWHQADDPPDAGSSPPVEFIIGPGSNGQGRLYLSLNRPDPANPGSSTQVSRHEVADLTPGVWHQFEVEISWHLSKGSIRVLHDGVEVVPRMQAQTIFPKRDDLTTPGCTYLKAGLYRRNLPAKDNGKPVGVPPNVGFVLHHDEIERFERHMRRLPRPWSWVRQRR